MFSVWTKCGPCQRSRKGPKMCSLSTQSRAAGIPGRASDRDRIGDPSMRLRTSYQPSNLCFFHCLVQSVRSYGPFSTSHTRLQDLSLPKGKRSLTAVCHTPKQQSTLQEQGPICLLLISPGIFLGELRNPKRPGPCPTKNCYSRAGSHPWVRCS